MNVPYNTGKISIGKYYQKPCHVEMDDDMLAVQDWLIGDTKRFRQRYWANVIYAITLILLVAIGIISYD
jgi:hypothetical protein